MKDCLQDNIVLHLEHFMHITPLFYKFSLIRENHTGKVHHII